MGWSLGLGIWVLAMYPLAPRSALAREALEAPSLPPSTSPTPTPGVEHVPSISRLPWDLAVARALTLGTEALGRQMVGEALKSVADLRQHPTFCAQTSGVSHEEELGLLARILQHHLESEPDLTALISSEAGLSPALLVALVAMVSVHGLDSENEPDTWPLFVDLQFKTGMWSRAWVSAVVGLYNFPEHPKLQWLELMTRPFGQEIRSPGEVPASCRAENMGGRTPLECCYIHGPQAEGVGVRADIQPHDSTHRWNGKRVAVVFRGHAHRDMQHLLSRSRSPSSSLPLPHPLNPNLVRVLAFDFRDVWHLHQEYVLGSLRDAGARIDVFASLHSSFLDAQVLELIQPKAYHFETNPRTLQGGVIATGIQLVQEAAALEGETYDLILVLRLDVIPKAGASTWPVDFHSINVPFRSINDNPQSCTCQVADTIIGFPQHLAARVLESCGPRHEHCHGLAGNFTKMMLWSGEQCFDSNTGRNAEPWQAAKNPFYVLYGRYYDYDDPLPIPHIPGHVVATPTRRDILEKAQRES